SFSLHFSREDDRSSFSRIRDADCDLLKRFNVRYICDFMVEYKKMKYWVPVTSSEKADSHSRYHDFEIIPMPYPGSEFFRVWRDSGYLMRGLKFDWDQPMIEVILRPESVRKTRLSEEIEWKNYKDWDVTTLTTNYLKLLLGLLFEGSGGISIHCVSGWDRTPLFISLMRCLLWADDLVHQSLSPFEMLYVTLAYDWFLFGHKLRTRMEMGEEILRFAFSYLAEVASDTSLSLSATYHMVVPAEYPTAEDGCQEFVEIKWSPHFAESRREKLRSMTQLFFSMWDNEVEASGIPRVSQASSRTTRGAWESGESEWISQSAPSSLSPSFGQFHQPVGAMVSQLSSAVTSAAAAVMSGLTKPLSRSRSVSESETAESN
ncbi:Myotubularin protein 14, partial [Fasciolopsis buskii]